MARNPLLDYEAQRQALAQAAGMPDFSGSNDTMRAAQGLLGSAMNVDMTPQPAGMTRDEAMQLMASLSKIGGNDPQYSELRSRMDELERTGPQSSGSSLYSNRNYAPSSDIARGILDTAEAMGADPLDLATAISYETAGTFDPTKAGPTTQWGQHRGLIQFGEPQAKQHGVDWNDPIGSQLGAGKAIQRYFEASGWKPGMSGLDLYSIINAGAPGRYGASDANNGGAPGSVRDKWENQMADHRMKAARLLGIMQG